MINNIFLRGIETRTGKCYFSLLLTYFNSTQTYIDHKRSESNHSNHQFANEAADCNTEGSC